MVLHRSIPLQKSVEQWLTRLQESVSETLRLDLHSCVKDIDNGLPYEELVSKVDSSIKTTKIFFDSHRCIRFSTPVKCRWLDCSMPGHEKWKQGSWNVRMIAKVYMSLRNVSPH